MIYDVGLENDRRGEVLRSVVDVVGGQSGTLGLIDTVTKRSIRSGSIQDSCSAGMRSSDKKIPGGDGVAGLQEGDVVRGFDSFAYIELWKTRVYVEIAEPLGGRDVLTSIVARNHLRVGWVNA